MNRNKFRVILFDTKYRNPNHYICLGILGALKRHPDVELVIKPDPLDAVASAVEHRCNLFIAFDGEEMDAALCKRLATICGRSALWVTEDPYELEVNLRHAGLFDLVFTNDSASVQAYGPRGLHLPLAGATEFHSLAVPPADQPLRYQLFFAGTAWPNRSAFLRTVIRDVPQDWKFKLALPTNPFVSPHGIDLPVSMLSWRTSPTNFARFANQTSVTLMLPRVFSASGGREYAETPPPRLFEAALAGGVQMIHESLSEAAHSFKPDEEIVFFSSPEDFVRKATALVNDRPYRDRIAQAARQRALEDHTYDNRARTILDRAAEITQKPPTPRLKAKRTLMLVVHNVATRGNFGGVEIYLDRLRHTLRDEWRVLFYVPDMTYGQRSAKLLAEDYSEIEHVTFSRGYSAYSLTCTEREAAFRRILEVHGVDLVHFHHFIGHVPSLVMVASQLGIPTAFTAHDYFGVCHEFNLLSFQNKFCGAPDVSIAQCDVCLAEKHGLPAGSQAIRRGLWDEALRHVDLLVFNTECSRRIYERTYPSVRQHHRVAILPVPIPDGAVLRKQGCFRVTKFAVLGNVTLQKGGHVLMRALAQLADAPVEFHIFGRVDVEFRRLSDRDTYKNVWVHGPYSADAIPVALRDCDVSLHTSIWPETYCLTLSESWQLGLVPIVSDIGALGERVHHMTNGLKIRPDNEGDLIDAIRLLADTPELLDSLRQGVSAEQFSAASDHVRLLSKQYSQLTRWVSIDVPRQDEPTSSVPLRELSVNLQTSDWTRGSTGAEQLLHGSHLAARARRLVHFYRRNGLRSTLRIVSNRVKRSR